ncbi:MAG: 3-dehydroquinate synthase [Hyphomicrobium sp.]
MTDHAAVEIVKSKFAGRAIVLVGLMGSGKSSIGRRLAARLQWPFVDADDEIEKAAAKTINDIFTDHGEAHFRDGERKVIARLLGNGSQVLATGGGAFVNPETRRRIQQSGTSVWLRAELPVLMRRVLKRDTRPLLRKGDPEATMKALIESRYPIYAEADVTVDSRDEAHEVTVTEILNSLAAMPDPPDRDAAQSGGASPGAHRTVTVSLGERSYDVEIGAGLLPRAGSLIKARLGPGKCAIVTDENVARHHLAALEAALKAENLHAGSIVLKPGEATKSFSELAPLCERLLELGLERGDVVVPFGGGVIGDLAGFAAGVLRRGVRFVQIPTTLLAQVDSSVGGKTGINTPQGKNLIGVFHQPSLVLADTDVLKSLPPREMRAGYAEVAKYALLGDEPFFTWLEANWKGVLAGDAQPLTHAIVTSVKAKAAIVERDETETGDRALLNLGHTFGHALEAWTGYSDRLLHGEGVAIGLCLAFRLSEQLELCPKGSAERVTQHVSAVGLPTEIKDIPGGKADADELIRLMGQDKKVRQGKLTFILARRIGEAFVTQNVVPETVKAFMAQQIGA